jgi:RNA polymerase sigma-70 factor, ECF subfamily
MRAEPDWTLNAIPTRMKVTGLEVSASESLPLVRREHRPSAEQGSRQSKQVQLLERPTHRSNECVPTGSVARARRTETAELPEAEAIRLAQQGDSAAFERIYRLHSRRVYSLCLRMVGNTTEAEDLTQEAFLQLFRKISTFRGESAFSTWLHRLAVNVVLMKLRKKSGTETSLEEVTEPDEESGGPRRDFGTPDLRLVGSIDRVNLQRAVDRLPPGYKSVFVLHDVQGYEHNEIAEIMGCSIGNSKSQLHKARMRLRELLHEVIREKAREERRAASGSVGEG